MQKVKINAIKTNPKNPRLIKDDKFKKLVKSIQEFPQMLELRPIVVDENNIILGGNMRYKACIEAGLKEIFILKAEDLTEQQKDEFIVKDNVGFGEWDWDILANEWDTDKLQDWGLDLPVFMDEPSYEDLIGEEKNKPASMRITFTSPEQLQKAEIEIQELLDRNYLGAYFSVSAGEI
jgi:ParB-like chromosome segregation protein Spo0J